VIPPLIRASLPLICTPAGPLDNLLGDEGYIIQWESSPEVTNLDFVANVTGPALDMGTLSASAGGGLDLTGSVALTDPINQSWLNIQFKGDEWVASFNSASAAPAPAATSHVVMSASLQPFAGDLAVATGKFGVQNFVPLVDISSAQPQSSPIDMGNIHYNNPYPSTWLPVFQGYADASVGDGDQDTVINSFATTVPPTVFGPMMFPIQNPTMNGLDLFTAADSDFTIVDLGRRRRRTQRV
jgi:hypothetical protein